MLSDGGMILINDCDSLQFPGVSRAVGEFCRDRGLYVIPLNDLHGSAILLKQGEGND
jgi:O-methyltransferase